MYEVAFGLPIIPKSEVGREVSWSHRVQDHIVQKSWLPRGAVNVIGALECGIVNRGLFISMLTTDEDPFFHKGFLTRISNRDPEGFPMTNPT